MWAERHYFHPGAPLGRAIRAAERASRPIILLLERLTNRERGRRF